MVDGRVILQGVDIFPHFCIFTDVEFCPSWFRQEYPLVPRRYVNLSTGKIMSLISPTFTEDVIRTQEAKSALMACLYFEDGISEVKIEIRRQGWPVLRRLFCLACLTKVELVRFPVSARAVPPAAVRIFTPAVDLSPGPALRQ